jgi:hypothetical protein
MLLTSSFAGNLIAEAAASGRENSIHTTATAFCAVATQGRGCLIAFMISGAFIYRLMTQKLPRDMQRPGVVRISFIKIFTLNGDNRHGVMLKENVWFISIGPFAFTVAGIVMF